MAAINPHIPTLYVYVSEVALVKLTEDPKDPGRWLEPGSAIPMTEAQLEALRTAAGDKAATLIARVETIAEHHAASVEVARIERERLEAEAAAADESGEPEGGA